MPMKANVKLPCPPCFDELHFGPLRPLPLFSPPFQCFRKWSVPQRCRWYTHRRRPSNEWSLLTRWWSDDPHCTSPAVTPSDDLPVPTVLRRTNDFQPCLPSPLLLHTRPPTPFQQEQPWTSPFFSIYVLPNFLSTSQSLASHKRYRIRPGDARISRNWAGKRRRWDFRIMGIEADYHLLKMAVLQERSGAILLTTVPSLLLRDSFYWLCQTLDIRDRRASLVVNFNPRYRAPLA